MWCTRTRRRAAPGRRATQCRRADRGRADRLRHLRRGRPAKEITDLAGVGVGTLYRHFPQRSDLVKAVVESGIDAVADAGPALSAAHKPVEALTQWIHRFTQLLATRNADSPRRCTRGHPGYRGAAGPLPAATWPHPRRAPPTPRWPTARFATTSAPRISCTPSLSCPSPSPGEGPSTTSTSLPSSSTACAAMHAAASRAFRVLTPTTGAPAGVRLQ